MKGLRQVYQHYFAFPASVEVPRALDVRLLASAGNGAGVWLKKTLADRLSPAVYQRQFHPPSPFPLHLHEQELRSQTPSPGRTSCPQLPVRRDEPSTHVEYQPPAWSTSTFSHTHVL